MGLRGRNARGDRIGEWFRLEDKDRGVSPPLCIKGDPPRRSPPGDGSNLEYIRTFRKPRAALAMSIPCLVHYLPVFDLSVAMIPPRERTGSEYTGNDGINALRAETRSHKRPFISTTSGLLPATPGWPGLEDARTPRCGLVKPNPIRRGALQWSPACASVHGAGPSRLAPCDAHCAPGDCRVAHWGMSPALPVT
jgi:hypothetical protein